MWLGMDTRTNEVIVFGPDGVDRARTFRRRILDEAYNKDEILKANVIPWDQTMEARVAPTAAPEPEPVHPEPPAPGLVARSMQIRRGVIRAVVRRGGS